MRLFSGTVRNQCWNLAHTDPVVLTRHSSVSRSRPAQAPDRLRRGYNRESRREIRHLQERTGSNIRQEIASQALLASGGYQSVVFNMLFLVSTRVGKMLRGEAMDEELFRGYFVKLYRKIVQMEAKLLNVIDDDDKDGFVLYSKSMRELATHYKVFKDPRNTP